MRWGLLPRDFYRRAVYENSIVAFEKKHRLNNVQYNLMRLLHKIIMSRVVQVACIVCNVRHHLSLAGHKSIQSATINK